MRHLNNKLVSKELFFFTIFFIIVLFSDFFGFSEGIRAIGQRLSQPVLAFHSRILTDFFSPYLNFKNSLSAVRKIQDLEIKYSEASAMLGEIDALRLENSELRKLLENTDRKIDKTIIASPVISLARPAIGSGKLDGVVEGSMVIAGQTLVGVVSNVYDSQSEVSLLFNMDSKPVIAKTEKGIQGLVVGDGKRVLLTEIPLDADLEINERVVSMGQKGIVKDVFIGRIQSIESQPNSSSKKAVIEQYVSFYEVAIVEVR